jgi:hypothetical protein
MIKGRSDLWKMLCTEILSDSLTAIRTACKSRKVFIADAELLFSVAGAHDERD